jgi:hypothetical protein
VEGNRGLVAALSLFAAVTTFALQSDQDVVRIHYSFSFFTVTMVLATALFIFAVKSALLAKKFSSILALSALCATLLASLLSLVTFWYKSFESALDFTASSRNYWAVIATPLILSVVLVIMASFIRDKARLRLVPLSLVAVLIGVGWGLIVSGDRPSGRWASVPENAAVGQEIKLTARTYPMNWWKPQVKYVNFMANINDKWTAVCPRRKPRAGTTDIYECPSRISEDVSRGPLTVTFDVHDARGLPHDNPGGERHITIR